MMRRIVYLLIFLFSSQAVQAQLVSWRDVLNLETATPDYHIPFGADSLQYGELWLPGSEAPHSSVIMIHGGCWLAMYPGVELMNAVAEDLSSKGFAVWNIDYRRIGHPGGGYPGTFLDVANGADEFIRIAEKFNLPKDRIIAAGHSAGGHLATWLAIRPQLSTESELYTENPIRIDAVVSLAGINDLERYALYGASPCGRNTVEQLIDAENRKSPYHDTSPSEMLPLSVPLVEISAAFDEPVPPFLGYHFVNEIVQAGGSAEHILLQNAGHYEMIYPPSSEWESVLEVFETILDR
jgi:acetyl esterase/lipase